MSRNINFPDKPVTKTYILPNNAPYNSYPIVITGADGAVNPPVTAGLMTSAAASVANHVGAALIIPTGPNRGSYRITAVVAGVSMTLDPVPRAVLAGMTFFAGGIYLPLTAGTNGCLQLKKINGIVGVTPLWWGLLYASYKGVVILQMVVIATGAEVVTTTDVSAAGATIMGVSAVGI